jgi:phospholipase C
MNLPTPNRRDFLSLAASIAGAGIGATSGVLGAIERAAAIEPEYGSSYLDAEHVVILMQENRSFDHTYGTLRGVRGFNDPRAIRLPDGNPVWVQTDSAGKRYVPFRYDIKNTNITWTGCLPHGWADQVDARNGGRYDQWLKVKQHGERAYAAMPLTLGYFTREDIPFYYALADAFTVCDQYFCSSLTGTTPNRCYLWTGTVRERPTAAAPAVVRNEECDLDHLVNWPTFPERLESLGVSWKVYQNELTVLSGFTQSEDNWLSNFGDNPLEYFRQYHVHLSPRHRAFIDRRIAEIPGELAELNKRLDEKDKNATAIAKRIAELTSLEKRYRAERDKWAGKSLDTLSPRERAIHERAFTINEADPEFRQLTEITYQDGDAQRSLQAPRGDLFHQFRADVNAGKLPTVSWIVAPQAFSDHPSSAWYGAWYIAEVMDILTKNPDVWKKTIFMLTYDENDGYFDHVPPFVAPHPKRKETGLASKGIDTSVDWVELAQDRMRGWGRGARGSSIGLGYRVPMVIASPWSRGGCVCSQVSDHTSVVQFLEKLLTHKLGKPVVETNISQWRRAVCGDLTTSFQAAPKEGERLTFPPRDEFLEGIHQAQFRSAQGDLVPLSDKELAEVRELPKTAGRMARQEPGVRPSCPLPYELVVDGALSDDGKQFVVRFGVGKEVFGDRSAGAPFVAYAIGTKDGMSVRDFAVEPGDQLNDSWPLADFVDGKVHLRIHGPNGFFRELIGSATTSIEVAVRYARSAPASSKLTGEVEVDVINRDARREYTVTIDDNAYGSERQSRAIAAGEKATFLVDAKRSGCWYDFSVRVAGVATFVQRFAGRVETGAWSTSDPAMA